MCESKPVPCAIYRGGTSRGVLFRENDLPESQAIRTQILLNIFGSPDPRQINGVGGGPPTSQTYVTALYQELLHRAPSTTELQTSAGSFLTTAGREQVALCLRYVVVSLERDSTKNQVAAIDSVAVVPIRTVVTRGGQQLVGVGFRFVVVAGIKRCGRHL